MQKAKIIVIAGSLVVCAQAFGNDEQDQCLLQALKSADQSTTAEQIRAECTTVDGVASSDGSTDYEQGAIRERLRFESAAEDSPFVFTPHLPNFIGWSSFDPNQAPFTAITGNPETVKDDELVFQVSFKAPIWQQMFGTNLKTYFAYTSKSWWQLSNDDFSSPFRETNYMPEVFVRGTQQRRLFADVALEGWTLGFVHQSNGREQALSRSWDRILGRYALRLNSKLSLLGEVWYRIPEDEADDDNPFEHRYYGYGDFRLVWTPNRSTFTALLRPGTQELSYELSWSYPINDVFRLHASYYDGYGESLLDYDQEIQRFTVGVSVSDFFRQP